MVSNASDTSDDEAWHQLPGSVRDRLGRLDVADPWKYARRPIPALGGLTLAEALEEPDGLTRVMRYMARLEEIVGIRAERDLLSSPGFTIIAGVGVSLARPLVEVQEAESQSSPGLALLRVIDLVWLEVASDNSPEIVWSNMLEDLAIAFDDHVDVSADGEDFLSLAASQVGEILELMASGTTGSSLWEASRRVYQVLDQYLGETGRAGFFVSWLEALRTDLENGQLAQNPVGDTRRQVEDAVQQIMHRFAEAFRASQERW